MTPYESGFSGLGAFIPTSCLGSKFEGGALIEKRKEMDMVLLQGGEPTDTHMYKQTCAHTHTSIYCCLFVVAGQVSVGVPLQTCR